MHKGTRNRNLIGGVSGLALLTMLATSPAFAQTSQPATAKADDEIVVTGTRLQNQKATAQKRNSDRIIDAITADDVGSLPDFSVADALTRIPGVSVESRNGDSEFVVIRGLRSDFNYLSIDGGIVPSTRKGGRATQTSIIPSYVIKNTEVIKSFTADLDGNAIGGHVSVNTRSAFDQSDTYFAARGALGFFGNSDGPVDTDLSNRADFAFAKQFGDNDQFGIVLSGSHLKQDYYTELPGTNWQGFRFYNQDEDKLYQYEHQAGPDPYLVPGGVQYYKYKNKIERLGGLAKLEWSPNDDFYLSLTGYQFKEDDSEDRWSSSVYDSFWSRDRVGYFEDITETTGHAARRGKGYLGYFFQGDTNTVRSLSLNSSWSPSEKSKVDFLATIADGKRENPFEEYRYFSTSNDLSWTYDSSDRNPVIAFDDPAAFENSDLFKFQRYKEFENSNEQKASQFKVDYSWNMDADQGFGYKAGLSSRADERLQDDDGSEWGLSSGSTFDTTPGRFLTDYNETYNGMLSRYLDQNAFFDYFETNQSEFRNWRVNSSWDIKDDYAVKEDVLAGYFMTKWKGPNYVLNAGLRYEDTSLTSSGNRLVDGTYEAVTETADYGNLLPSLSLIWDASNDWRLRGAYSRSLGRAEYKDLTVLGSETIDTGLETISRSTKNPQLLPRISDNWDASMEYYFPNIDGALSVGLFYKNIENEIFTRREAYSEDVNGVTYAVRDTQPSNANSASIRGLEAGITVNSFDFINPGLEDFGFSANYAHIDSTFEIEMSDNANWVTQNGLTRELYGLNYQPKNIFKLNAFWSPGDFEFKTAYRYTDKSLAATNATGPSGDQFNGETHKVDMQARYKLARGWKVFVDARNVLDNSGRRDYAYGDKTYYSRSYGRSAWFGVTYKYY